MAKDYSPEQRALLRGHRIELAAFIDLFCEPTSLHCCSLYTPTTYDVGDGSRTYEAMADRVDLGETPISMGADLTPEPLVIKFDASRITDNGDFVGRFADNQLWHRRQARLTLVTFAVDSGWSTPIGNFMQWEGEMDFRDHSLITSAAPTLPLTIESGTFRYLGKNVQTRTDENQQRFFPGDKFFQDLPGLIGRQLPWARSWVGIGQSPANAGGNPFNPGGDNGGGGGNRYNY